MACSSGCRVLTAVTHTRTTAGDLLMDWIWEAVTERRLSRLTPMFLVSAVWWMVVALD